MTISESDFWDTKTIKITGVEVDNLPKLDIKIAEHAVHGWEPWAWAHGGTTWIVSLKRRRQSAKSAHSA